MSNLSFSKKMDLEIKLKPEQVRSILRMEVLTIDTVDKLKYKDYSCVLYTKSSDVDDNYYLTVFKNNNLLYWGYPFQFLISDDTLKYNLGVKISEILMDKEKFDYYYERY